MNLRSEVLVSLGINSICSRLFQFSPTDYTDFLDFFSSFDSLFDCIKVARQISQILFLRSLYFSRNARSSRKFFCFLRIFFPQITQIFGIFLFYYLIRLFYALHKISLYGFTQIVLALLVGFLDMKTG